MTQHLVTRMVVAVLGAVAAVFVVTAAPAQAAYCSAEGVGVLVDYGDLGGGESTGCGSGEKANEAFTSAGYQLTSDARQQDYVCKVQGKPADGNCLKTDRYWAFFVSRAGGGWTYASLGVYSQTVHVGDSVALVWQSTDGRRTPDSGPWQPAAPSTPAASTPAAPPTSAPAPSVKTTKAGKPGKRPAKNPTRSQGTVAKPTPTVSALPSKVATSATRSAVTTPSPTPATPTPTPTPTATAPTTDPATTAPTAPSSSAAASETPEPEQPAADPAADDGGLPGWVAPVAIVVLLLGAGGVAVARRRG